MGMGFVAFVEACCLVALFFSQRRAGFSIVCATVTESETDSGPASTRRRQHSRHRLHNRCRRRHWRQPVIDILIRLARLVFHIYRFLIRPASHGHQEAGCTV